MQIASPVLCLSLFSALAIAQSPDDGSRPTTSDDPRVMLEYAQFDPTVRIPTVPPRLAADQTVNLFIVQFQDTPTEADRDAVRAAGGVIKSYLPHDCHLVLIPNGEAMNLYSLREVRWVGAYEPAYRLEPFLVQEHVAGTPVPRRTYNMVMVDKRNDKNALAAKVQAIGGEIVNQHEGGLLFTASFNGQQLLSAAKFDEVLWIDRTTDTGEDMDNARIQGGADYIESVAGYTGSGIRGHVYEGVEANHPDFNTVMAQLGPAACSAATSHGHCTAGIIFGNGNSAPQARGLAPDAVGFYTTYVSSSNTTCATSPSRNTILGNAVNTNQVMFTTASWGNARTFFYTSDSADADDIVFDHRIPWTQSQSNAGNQDSRPQAWGKNIISVGGVSHGNNSSAADDSWLGGNGSTGPAQDTRSKPDLAAYYDQIWTSDRTGGSGYAGGNSYTNFGGTSGATPIVAGHNALAIQMYTDHIFSNPPRVPGGTRFENRPYAQTLKALQIACANMYTPSAADNRREHVGWGFPSVRNMWDRRDKISIIPENVTITQGATRTYQFEVDPGESIVKFVMTYLDPAGNPAAAFDRVNDLTLRVIQPNGTAYWGNRGLDGASQSNQSATGGSADTRDTVECVIRNNPQPGVWTVQITAPVITQDAHLATGTTDATFALVVNGGRRVYGSGCAEFLPDNSTSSEDDNMFPWGGYAPSETTSTFVSDNQGSDGGAVYFDVTVTTPVWIHGFDLNTDAPVGDDICLDLYTKSGTSVGSETTAAAWTPRTAGKGVSAGLDAPSTIRLGQPFRLNAGTYGFAIVASNFGHNYTNGTNSYTTGALTLDTGSATNVPFTGSVFSPRSANVTIRFRNATSTAQNMRYQTIMRSDELGGAGQITGLAFSGNTSGHHFSSNLMIRMAHRPAGYTLSTTFNNNISGNTLVMNANTHWFEYRQNQWRNVGMQSPFNYNGVDDVVVEIISRGNVQTTYDFPDGMFNADPNRQRVVGISWDLSQPTSGTFWPYGALRMRAEFGCANANTHGITCGKLETSYSGSPSLGSSFNFNVSGATPNLVAFIGLGLSNTAPYPFPLTTVGFTNCVANHNSIVVLAQPTNGTGDASYAQPIPNNASLTGFLLFGQWIGLDSSEPGDLTFSNVTRMHIGTNP